MIRAKDWHNPPKENQKTLVLTLEIKMLKERYLNGEKAIQSRNKEAWKKVALSVKKYHESVFYYE